ncbi:MAG: tryptophan-rich sensory protein [Verrucomicrobia bacterium]|nr:MAG: tryptophan-rich sensory protein [Verrucomicrobiota bacterium]
MNRWIALGLFLLASFTASAIGGYATFESVRTWYPTLAKPSWNPPAAVFGPVWTLLYTLMAFAAWRIWLRRELAGARPALRWFFVSLALNALWSVLFFGLHRPGLALLEVVLFWGTLVLVQLRFARLDRVAGWLWAPYVAWVSFATVLNAAIWRLNP